MGSKKKKYRSNSSVSRRKECVTTWRYKISSFILDSNEGGGGPFEGASQMARKIHNYEVQANLDRCNKGKPFSNRYVTMRK